MSRQGAPRGPVRFRIPDGYSTEEVGHAQEYVEAAERARADRTLSTAGRQTVKGELKAAKDRAARAERIRAEAAGEPYGPLVAAHLPDTTWTGTSDPPEGWGRHTHRVNSLLGSLSAKYPLGYIPENFALETGEDDDGRADRLESAPGRDDPREEPA
ncbi:hypothetical protein R8Z50_13370 [Longispora sp. K20-0274]|uniref:hypothetical protein n=1 Tax=Longispora sp. K20-0274 TaxID=3088255 RepID=UPI00399A8FEB